MFRKFINWLLYHTLCKAKGHDWEVYSFSTGYIIRMTLKWLEFANGAELIPTPRRDSYA